MDFVFNYGRAQGAKKVSIGIVDETNMQVLVVKPCLKGSMNWSYFAIMVIKKRLSKSEKE